MNKKYEQNNARTNKISYFQKKGDKLFTGVCLDFGMVIQGKTIDEVKNELSAVSLGYLKTVKKRN